MFNTKGQRFKGSRLRQQAIFLFTLLCSIATLTLCVKSVPAQTTATIKWVKVESGKMAVELTGLDAATLQQLAKWNVAQFQKLLAVYVGQPDANVPPMLGSYRIHDNALRFEPQFALEPGVTYRAVFLPGKLPGGLGNSVVTATFTPPSRDLTPTTVVAQIYPSSNVVPENLLKFYLHFSAPMRRGNVYEYIRLLDESGNPVELPFLEIDEELWNHDLTRLTLFIDPGRIKRGVKPLEEIGPSLESGKRYRLVIDREWRDGNGAPLKESFEKAFTVAPPDRQPPNPADWKLETPNAGTRAALTIRFPEPMEHALAQRLIAVTKSTGESIAGSVMLDDQERRWTFIPDAAWQSGRYHVVIQTTIEDLAGNNIGKPFEVDVFKNIQRHLTSQTVKLTFEIR